MIAPALLLCSIALGQTTNRDVMTRLTPLCGSCHQSGASKPFFGSLQAFEAGLVYNPYYVTPGQPGASRLVKVLLGLGEGTYPKMPPVTAFAALEAQGKTAITMAEIRAWIQTLPERSTLSSKALAGPIVRRLRTEVLLTVLNQALGLEDTDLFSFVTSTPTAPAHTLLGLETLGVIFVKDAAAMPARSDDAPWDNSLQYSYTSARVEPRFAALGGPSWLTGKPRSNDISPVFLSVFVPLTQARCRTAVLKPGNTTFFRFATAAQTSASAAAAIRKNIDYLATRVWGEPPAPAELDALLAEVFQVYEPSGRENAWTAVCAAILRDPRGLTY
jgi:hypothetical protein